MINTNIMQYHNANRYFNIFVGDGLDGKRMHIENVLSFTNLIFELSHNPNIDKSLLLLCAEHHDDGRVNQYELLGKFWDNKLSHNILGLERFDSFLQNSSDISIDDSITIFRDCILYHGRESLVVSEGSKPYVEIITAADNFENAISCISYLLTEIETDAKGYRKTYPEMDQKSCSSFVFEHFSNGEKFDKLKYCKTYAEYVLFAATLATNCIRKYGPISKTLFLQPKYGYSSVLEGYKKVFDVALSEETSKKAYNILCNMLL